MDKTKAKKKGMDFKTAPDGRLIISDAVDSEDESGLTSKRKFTIPGLEDSGISIFIHI